MLYQLKTYNTSLWVRFILLLSAWLMLAPQANALTSQTITGFSPTTPITYSSGETFSLTAKGGGSGNAVTFASTTSTICTVSNSTVSVLSAGTCTLTANQAGNTTYAAAAQVTANVVINKASQTISFASLAGKTFGAAPFTVSGTASSGLALTYTSTTTSVCTVSGSTVTLAAIGTCTIAANQAGNTNFNAATQVTQSFTVAKESQTITFAALAGKTYGAAPFTVSATSSAGLAVSFTSATTSVCTVSGSTVTLAAIGTCTIDANQAGNGNVSAATQVAESFTVAKESQTITFGTLAGQTYGAAPFTVSATSSAGLAVAFTSTTTSVCTVSGSTVTIVAIGTCTIAANQAGNSNVSAATQVTQSFTVAKASQTITFAALSSKNLGTAPFTVSATSTSGLPVTYTSTTTPVCTVSGSTVTLVSTGTCTIAANQAGNASYAAATQVTQSFTVSNAVQTQTITFAALSAKTYGAAPFTVSATASSGLTVTFTSSTTSVCTVSSNTVTLVSAGTCTIDANQAGNASYSAASQVAQSFTVAKESQSITFGTLAGKTLGAAPFTVSATSSASLAVAFTSSTTAVCTVSGTTVTLVAAGTCTVAANQSGNTNVSTATQVTQSFAVANSIQAQTISFAELPNLSLAAAPFTVSASASSGLPVTLTSSSTSVCTVSGTTVTLVATGTCTITASQSGNASYSAAPTVSQSFMVSATSVAQNFAFTYDPTGRVIEAVGLSSFSNQVAYDPVGNIDAVSNGTANTLAIVQFFPTSGAAGNTVTINGTGFDPNAGNDIVTFNGVAATVTSASATTLTVLVPATASTGVISIADGNGSVSSSAPFTIGLALATGNAPVAVNLAANQVITYQFNGTIGQGYTLSLTNVGTLPANGSWINTTVSLPNGSFLPGFACEFQTDTACVLPNLPATGIYTVTFYPGSAPPPTLNMSLIPDLVATLTPDVSVSFAPGFNQAGTYTFSGTAGQITQLVLSYDTIVGVTGFQISAPDGSSLYSSSINRPASILFQSYVQPLTLPQTGTYTLRLKPPMNNSTWNMNVLLASVVTGNITVGTSLPTTLATGQQAVYNFNGTVGQSLGLGLTALTVTPVGGIQQANYPVSINVVDPNGSSIANNTAFGVLGTSFGQTLPILTTSGKYTVQINPQGNVSTFNLLLSADVTGTLTVNGATVNSTIAQVGQAASYTFSGTAAQNLTLQVSNDTVAYASFYVYEPNGTLFATYSLVGGTGQPPGAFTLSNLPSTGTYTIRVLPQGNDTGSMSLGLTQ